MEKEYWVKYYKSKNNAYGFYISYIEEILKDSEYIYSMKDINKILELYNVALFLKDSQFTTFCKSRGVELPNNNFMKIIGLEFSKLNNENIQDVIVMVDVDYVEDFFELFDKFKLYKRVLPEKLSDILNNNLYVNYLMRFKNIVVAYEDYLLSALIKNEMTAEIILHTIESRFVEDDETIYYPSTMSDRIMNIILNNYIDSSDCNIGYLELIHNTKIIGEFKVYDKTRVLAKRRYDVLLSELLNAGTNIKYGVSIEFKKNFPTIAELKMDGTTLQAVYSEDWIENNLDFPTLLNNFIYMFNFVDMTYRIQHVRKKHEISPIEMFMGIKGKRDYLFGIIFKQMQMLAQMQMQFYYWILKKYNVSLEEVINYFFNDYIKNEFNITGFRINLSENIPGYLFKCRNIISEIDSVLRQFIIFIENGLVDDEMLQVSSRHIFFNDIPSSCSKKYAYLKGEEYFKASNLLFSSQSGIRYHILNKKTYKNFVDMITSDDCSIACFSKYHEEDITWLKEKQYIYIDNDGILHLDSMKVKQIADFYYNDVINMVDKSREDYLWLEDREMIYYEGLLFAECECDYFDFILNKSKYDNGADLRNRYTHGTQSFEEKEHETNYFIFLRILILIIIKMNEEFLLIEKKII